MKRPYMTFKGVSRDNVVILFEIPSGDATWPELLEYFVQFLRGNGYFVEFDEGTNSVVRASQRREEQGNENE